MASISTDSGGKRRILFVDADGTRRQVRLGSVPMKTAADDQGAGGNPLAAALASTRSTAIRPHGWATSIASCTTSWRRLG